MSAGTAVGGARELLGMRGTAWSSWPETAPSPLRFFKKVPWCMVCGRAAADVTYQISTYYWISTYTLRISTYTLLPMLLPVLVPRARLYGRTSQVRYLVKFRSPWMCHYLCMPRQRVGCQKRPVLGGHVLMLGGGTHGTLLCSDGDF